MPLPSPDFVLGSPSEPPLGSLFKSHHFNFLYFFLIPWTTFPPWPSRIWKPCIKLFSCKWWGHKKEKSTLDIFWSSRMRAVIRLLLSMKDHRCLWSYTYHYCWWEPNQISDFLCVWLGVLGYCCDADPRLVLGVLTPTQQLLLQIMFSVNFNFFIFIKLFCDQGPVSAPTSVGRSFCQIPRSREIHKSLIMLSLCIPQNSQQLWFRPHHLQFTHCYH